MELSLVVDSWDYGTLFAEELLDAIAALSKTNDAGSLRKNPKKIESEGFTIYWAGTVLRIDIPEKELV